MKMKRMMPIIHLVMRVARRAAQTKRVMRMMRATGRRSSRVRD